ncbi:hypothetical protein F4780DRAFT_263731 [Xylariomycetidae sp. FL0641]|nr:hypothetical protein F4780DRAFT_263731 [Xylariomycetidae sp. FL0641]
MASRYCVQENRFSRVHPSWIWMSLYTYLTRVCGLGVPTHPFPSSIPLDPPRSHPITTLRPFHGSLTWPSIDRHDGMDGKSQCVIPTFQASPRPSVRGACDPSGAASIRIARRGNRETELLFSNPSSDRPRYHGSEAIGKIDYRTGTACGSSCYLGAWIANEQYRRTPEASFFSFSISPAIPPLPIPKRVTLQVRALWFAV